MYPILVYKSIYIQSCNGISLTIFSFYKKKMHLLFWLHGEGEEGNRYEKKLLYFGNAVSFLNFTYVFIILQKLI